MKSSAKSAHFSLYLFFALLFSLQVVPRFWWDSLTNDEPSDITNGYYYLTQGDVVTPHNHPPLAGALNALPLLFMNLKTAPYLGDVITRGHAFLFDWNLDKLAPITVAARSVSWILGLALGFLLFWITRKDKALSVFTLFLWAFNPTLLALSAIAKTDIAPAFFFFLAVWLFQQSLQKPSRNISFVAGVITAMAITCKFYGLVLIPVYLALEMLENRTGSWKQFLPPKNLGKIKSRWCFGLGGVVLWIFLLYLPGTLLLPDHHWPFSYFLEKFKEDLAFAHNPLPVFFLGASGLQSHWYYLPVAFGLKEPLAFIVLLAVALFLVVRKKIKVPAWQWAPPLLFGLAVLPAPNLGVRYLLPAFPFLFLIAGQAVGWIWKKTGPKVTANWRLSVIGLALWQAVSVLLSFPHSLSYFNEVVPGDKKIHFLGDSNLDWGQDLKRLAAVSRERKWTKVRLAYLGGVDPAVYGLAWEPWRKSDLEGPQPGTVYLVNASFLQLAPIAYPPTRAIATSWIHQAQPTGKVADSWYYFEIPGKPNMNKDPFLVSAPFLMYRGFTAYNPAALPPR